MAKRIKVAKDHLRIERSEGAYWVTTEEIIFRDVEDMRELYHVIGFRLREITGHLGGRPRLDAPRCPCGQMTAKRAATLGHRCEAVEKL